MRDGLDRRGVLAGLGGLAATGACARGPAPLALDLSELEARHGGRLGLAARTSRGETAAWRGEERFGYCSTFKLFLAAATLERVRDGQERLDRPVPILESDMTEHAPVTAPAVGGTLTVEELCRGIIDLSDNPGANILIRELGGLDAWRDWHRRISDTVTSVDRLEPELNLPDGDKDTTTPNQTVANLSIVHGAAAVRLPGALRRMLFNWLIETPTGPGRLKAAAPEGWRVGHKTGTSAALTNDIGFLWPPEGAPVRIAAYFAAPPAAGPAQRDAVIADAARLALKALGYDGAGS